MLSFALAVPALERHYIGAASALGDGSYFHKVISFQFTAARAHGLTTVACNTGKACHSDRAAINSSRQPNGDSYHQNSPKANTMRPKLLWRGRRRGEAGLLAQGSASPAGFCGPPATNNMPALHPLFAARAQTSGPIVALTKDPYQLRRHCAPPRAEERTNPSPKSRPLTWRRTFTAGQLRPAVARWFRFTRDSCRRVTAEKLLPVLDADPHLIEILWAFFGQQAILFAAFLQTVNPIAI